MKGKKNKYYILCLAIFVIGGVIMALLYNSYINRACKGSRWSDKILIQYLEEVLEIRLEDYVEAAEGSVTIKEGEEDEAIIRIKVLEGYEEKVLELLRDNFFENDINNDMFPGKGVYANSGVYADIFDVFTQKVDVEDWKYVFECLGNGKYAKTKVICMYVAYEEAGMYVYFLV